MIKRFTGIVSTTLVILLLAYYGLLYYYSMQAISKLNSLNSAPGSSFNNIIFKSSFFEHKAVIYGLELKSQIGFSYYTSPKDKTIVKLNLLSRKLRILTPAESTMYFNSFIPNINSKTFDWSGKSSIFEGKIGDLWNIFNWSGLDFISSISYLRHYIADSNLTIRGKNDSLAKENSKTSEQSAPEIYNIDKFMSTVYFYDYMYREFADNENLKELKQSGVSGIYLPSYFEIISNLDVSRGENAEEKDYFVGQKIDLLVDLRGLFNSDEQMTAWLKEYKINNKHDNGVDLNIYLSRTLDANKNIMLDNEIFANAYLGHADLELENYINSTQERYYYNFLKSLNNDGYFDGNIKLSSKSTSKLTGHGYIPLEVELDHLTLDTPANNTVHLNGAYKTIPSMNVKGEFLFSSFSSFYEDIYSKLLDAADGLDKSELSLYNILAKEGLKQDLLYTINSASNYPNSSSTDLAIDFMMNENKFEIGNMNGEDVINNFSSLYNKYILNSDNESN